MKFWSPTYGKLTIEEVVQNMIQYIQSAPSEVYRIIIGTDSQSRASGTTFVTAILVHRVGRGARVFLSRQETPLVKSLKQKIYTEAAASIEVCSYVDELLQKSEQNWNLEIHIDVGTQGDTKVWVKEIVGWVTHSGFQAVIKPDSFGASKVADRYARNTLAFAR